MAREIFLLDTAAYGVLVGLNGCTVQPPCGGRSAMSEVFVKQPVSGADARTALATFYDGQESWYRKIAKRFPKLAEAQAMGDFMRQLSNAVSRFPDDHPMVRLSQFLLEGYPPDYMEPPAGKMQGVVGIPEVGTELFDVATKLWAEKIVELIDPEFKFALDAVVRGIWVNTPISEKWLGLFGSLRFVPGKFEIGRERHDDKGKYTEVRVTVWVRPDRPTRRFEGGALVVLGGRVYGSYTSARDGEPPNSLAYEFDYVALLEQLRPLLVPPPLV